MVLIEVADRRWVGCIVQCWLAKRRLLEPAHDISGKLLLLPWRKLNVGHHYR